MKTRNFRLWTNILDPLDRKIDWTISYRRDSSSYNPYCFYIPKEADVKELLREHGNRSEIQKIMARNFTGNLTENYESNKIFHQNVNVAKKKAKVIWIASNCKASSRRENYVQDLAKYVDLEIYGKCGKHPGLLEFEDLIVGHQFYLAFENEVSLDYFTEKLCRAMKTNAIPVVLGGAEYSKIVPPRSVINVANFESAFNSISKILVDQALNQ